MDPLCCQQTWVPGIAGCRVVEPFTSRFQAPLPWKEPFPQMLRRMMRTPTLPPPIPARSGGSIYVTAQNLEGSGSFTADGGSGSPWFYSQMRGGGGGGRIAVYYTTSSFTGISSAKGGKVGGSSGYDGTVVFIDTTRNRVYPGPSFRFQENDAPFSYAQIILNNSFTDIEGTVSLSSTEVQVNQGSVFNLNTPGVLTLTAATLHLDKDSTLILSGNETLNVNSVLLTNNSTITHLPEREISLKIPILTIDPTSSLSADGMGSSAGPGTEPTSLGGAGYGGKGGYGSYYSQYYTGGGTYGSAFQPTDLGSGHTGMPGGGAIRLDISDTLTLDGTITSDAPPNNANTYPPSPYPGSSGGSIFVTAKNLKGSGSFTADGGTGSNSYYGNDRGGGGGGRIAVYYTTSSFNGISSARGGPGGASYGSDGTVVFIDTTRNVVYPGHSFRFQENDAPFSYADVILNNSHTDIEGTFSLSSTEVQVSQGSVLNLNTPGVLSLTATTLHLDKDSTLILSGNETLNVNSVLLTNNSTITHVPEGKISLKIPILDIDPTSSLSADGMGSSAGPAPNRPVLEVPGMAGKEEMARITLNIIRAVERMAPLSSQQNRDPGIRGCRAGGPFISIFQILSPLTGPSLLMRP